MAGTTGDEPSMQDWYCLMQAVDRFAARTGYGMAGPWGDIHRRDFHAVVVALQEEIAHFRKSPPDELRLELGRDKARRNQRDDRRRMARLVGEAETAWLFS